jgi:Uncharacterized protein conserved in bacteria C-term(DUF2220)
MGFLYRYADKAHQMHYAINPDGVTGLLVFGRATKAGGIAVWGDLDACGIQIVINLAERLKRDITPVAMTADLYAGGTKYKPADIDDSKRVAEKIVTDGLPTLQGLAQAIDDADGLGCEQEPFTTRSSRHSPGSSQPSRAHAGGSNRPIGA